MRTELSRGLSLAGVFVLGLAAGVWSITSPWVVGYPLASSWSSSVWSSVLVGAVVAGASATGLVAVLARALYVTLNPPSAARSD